MILTFSHIRFFHLVEIPFPLKISHNLNDDDCWRNIIKMLLRWKISKTQCYI